jgi:hypothetical protein
VMRRSLMFPIANTQIVSNVSWDLSSFDVLDATSRRGLIPPSISIPDNSH